MALRLPESVIQEGEHRVVAKGGDRMNYMHVPNT